MNGDIGLNEKISILVPVYNVQDYLERCLDSILAQTYTEFEIICVNDGSTDGSRDILERYQKKDARINVLHIENHGVSYARNLALSVMTGAWFCFADSDDWLEPEYLSTLYRVAKENDADIAACFFQKNTEYTTGIPAGREGLIVLDSPQQCIHNFICGKNSMHGMIWNKLYKAELFKDIRFNPSIKVNEDCIYTYEIMQHCKKACITKVPLYHWFIRMDSACHTRQKVVDFGAANVFMSLYEKTLELKDDEVTRVLKKNYINAVVRVLLHAKYKKGNSEVSEAKKQCKEWRKSVWPVLNKRDKGKYILVFYGSMFLPLLR